MLTGADGFTGRHFVNGATAAGHTVIAIKSDLKDRDGLKQEILEAAPDAVVHLAAISFVGHADTSAFYDVNVIGTLNLLDGLAALPRIPQKILLASSANVYGNCEQSPIAEEQAPAPVNHYAMSKLAMEYMARNYLDRLPLFFVRPFNYTGLGQAESFLIPKLVAHFARRAAVVELGNLDVEREFNDVRFVCDAYLKLLDKGVSGEVYNVCSGKPVTLKSVIELLRKISGHELEVRVNPAFVRANEVHRLCGVSTKLEKCIGALSHPSLEETLRWMLKNPI
ncbi:polysaccharide biosynthesis family protein [Collimonas arenae]|uniref:Polysaccharide biosynthesis family protein n=1 Tax=Collimonas arenae TaxID=279058 RepID=A0A127PLP6_9BURK|nr:polysaccharide biosynthesis family protein [Collimonas arenae]AMP08588.1 polysaccharide biosynthesis family protein [Collimonas arenae]